MYVSIILHCIMFYINKFRHRCATAVFMWITGTHWTILTSLGMGGWPIMKQWYAYILIFDPPTDPIEKTPKHATTMQILIFYKNMQLYKILHLSVQKNSKCSISFQTYCELSRITQLWIINEAELPLTRSTDRGKCQRY